MKAEAPHAEDMRTDVELTSKEADTVQFQAKQAAELGSEHDARGVSGCPAG